MALEAIFKGAEIVTDLRRALDKVSKLETSIKNLAEAVDKLNDRIRELEIHQKVMASELMLETVREVQKAASEFNGHAVKQMTDLAIKVDRLEQGSLRSGVILTNSQALASSDGLAKRDDPRALPGS